LIANVSQTYRERGSPALREKRLDYRRRRSLFRVLSSVSREAIRYLVHFFVQISSISPADKYNRPRTPQQAHHHSHHHPSQTQNHHDHHVAKKLKKEHPDKDIGHVSTKKT
jgi:hypothetical protein